jgi:hypothetical protein
MFLGLGPNSGLHNEMSATDRLTHCTASVIISASVWEHVANNQCSETNMMHVLLNVLTVKDLYMC